MKKVIPSAGRTVRTRRVSRRFVLATSLSFAGLSLLPNGLKRNARASGFKPSPPTQPFIEELPVPPIAKPVTPRTFNPFPARALPADVIHYEITAIEARHSFHSQLPLNSIWGYDGITPGPTIVAKANTNVLVRFNNALPQDDPVQIGLPINAIHRHGGFQAPEDDGYPGNFFPTGASRDYLFLHPNEDSNLWYHDHSLDITAENVYRGLAGGYLIFDDLDSLEGEMDTRPNAFRLPGRMVGDTRVYDIALVFQDRQFDANGFLVYDSFDHNGFIGDKFLVNGKIQPFCNVEPRKYRLRFTNGSNARQYEFILKDGRTTKPFDYVIGTDDRLFETPLRDVESFRIASSERVQTVVDFSEYAGKEIMVVNRLAQKEGRKPDGVVDPGTPILKFIVGKTPVADPSQVPTTLRPVPDSERPANILKKGVKIRRQFEFGRSGGAWVVNNQLYDENRVDAKPVEDEFEIWTLKAGGGWEHPIHIHLTNFFIISRNGKPPAPIETGWKDVVVVGGSRGEVEILIKFSGYTGRYVLHCHTVEHEDARMMANFEIQPKRRA